MDRLEYLYYTYDFLQKTVLPERTLSFLLTKRVKQLEPDKWLFMCVQCGSKWQSKPEKGIDEEPMPQWVCPKGCNKDEDLDRYFGDYVDYEEAYSQRWRYDEPY